MNVEGKIEAVLDQEMIVKKGGLQTTYKCACLVLESGQSIPITAEAANQIREWKDGSTARITGIGEPLLEIECLG
jgi:hypothetical protein